MERKVNSRKERGFTLIELVVVIVILGILAATAVPKFVALDTDAKQAAVDATAGAIVSSATLLYASNSAKGVAAPNAAAVTSNTVYDSSKLSISFPDCATGATVSWTATPSITKATGALTPMCTP